MNVYLPGYLAQTFIARGDKRVDIKLNFINQANTSNDAAVVIFQKNVASNFDDLNYAWKVIRHCGQGDNHPFVFPTEMAIGASDAYGSYILPRLPAGAGQQFECRLASQGDELAYARDPAAPNPRAVMLRNMLSTGTINAYIYRSGSLLAAKTSIAPGQQAIFEFKPTIWIGVTSKHVEEGQRMSSGQADGIDTELSLLGVASADIVLTGGDVPYKFSLENVIKA